VIAVAASGSAGPAAASAGESLGAGGAASAGDAASVGGSAPDGGPMIFSGTASLQTSVVFDALGDHLHLGTCSGRDPVSMFDSFTAYLVDVPGPMLGGNVECGKQIAVTNTGGTTVYATIVGSCGSCSGGNLGLSPALYARLITLDQHDTNIPVTWKFTS
jgi:hypothetical protein